MAHWLAKLIYFKVLKWQIKGDYNSFKQLSKAVVIVAPHTSWHDFYIGVLIRSVVNTKVNFIGKKELFTFPFGYFFRALGGKPVDRKNNQDEVQAIANIFASTNYFKLALAPEGTRKKVLKWRTGFYYIAKTANVPIVMVALDFKTKQARFSEPFRTSENKSADFQYIKDFYKGVTGKIPEYT